jgi:hypothetical protein
MASKRLRAYIAAPATLDPTPIRDFLDREGVDSDDAYSIAAGTDLLEALIRRIRVADFAVAVLNEDAGWTAYELGLCDALAKPVLVIASPALSAPASIASHPLIRTSIGNSDVWQLALKKFVQEVREDRAKPGHHRPRRSQGAKGGSTRLLDLAEQIHAERENGSPSRVEELTLDVFRTAAVIVVAQEPRLADRGADFAVWDDRLAHSVGLPIFVELKVGNLDGQRLKETEWQLADAMRASSGRLGLVLYLDRNGRRFPTPTWDAPFVVRFDLEDFARDLARRPFAELVVEQRNKLVHGMG